VYDACINEGIDVISTRHEAAAVYMAEATSYSSRKVGVAVLAGGPELTNALTGLAKAFYASTPLLVLAGTNTLKKLDLGFPQDMDQLGLVSHYTKWAKGCYDGRRIPEYIAAAFSHSLRGRPGPVYLEIPYDILEGDIKGAVDFPDKPERLNLSGDPVSLDRARELLISAKRPIAIAGSGAVWSKSESILERFVQETSIPLLLAPTASPLMLPEELITGIGSPGVSVFSLETIARADLILLLGVRMNFVLGFGDEPFMSEGQKIIQVDIEPEELDSLRRIDVPIVGDLSTVLGQWLEGGIQTPQLGQWLEELESLKLKEDRELAPLKNSDQFPIHPLRLVQDIEHHRGERSSLVLDGANSVLWNFLTMRPRKSGQILLSAVGSLEAIGAGIPHAIGLKLENPDQEVILHVGDGSFGYHFMEYETAMRYGIPFVAVVHNDRGWGMTRDMQREFYGKARQVGNELLDVRYDLLVRALGGYGEHVTEPSEISGAIQRASDSGLPACVNVSVDPQPQSPGLVTFMLLEVMLGRDSFYNSIPDLVQAAGRLGMDRVTSRFIRRFLARQFHGQIE
jgi:thiamine pyrophosphate-dependent acetolactate synthase large subunit-like protein